MKTDRFIIKMPFRGNAETLVTAEGKVYYSDLTLEEYLKQDDSLKVVSDEEFDKLFDEFHRSPFIEIPYERWEEMLECLPPLRWHTIADRWNVFYCEEALSGQFNGLYVKDEQTEKCYAGTKSRFLTDAQILADIENEILTANK